MQAGMDGLIVRSVDVVRDIEEVSSQSREAVGLTNRVGIMIPTQRQRDLQIGTDAPFILAVESQSIYCYGLRRTDREVLYVADSLSVVEPRQILSLTVPDGANARRVIRHIIAMEEPPTLSSYERRKKSNR